MSDEDEAKVVEEETQDPQSEEEEEHPAVAHANKVAAEARKLSQMVASGAAPAAQGSTTALAKSSLSASTDVHEQAGGRLESKFDWGGKTDRDGVQTSASVHVHVALPKRTFTEIKFGKLAPGNHTKEISIPVANGQRETPKDQLWGDEGAHGGAVAGGVLDSTDLTARASKKGFPDKKFSRGVVPEVWHEGARNERVEAVDADCDTQHRAVNKEPYATIDVSEILLPNEEVLLQIPCLGFSNFPNVDTSEAVGDCWLVMTQIEDGGRRIFMVQNKQERSLDATEFYDNDTDKTCCGPCMRKTARIEEEQDYAASRSGYMAMYVFSVDSQLLNMWSEVVTSTSIQRSRKYAENSKSRVRCCPHFWACICPCWCRDCVLPEDPPCCSGSCCGTKCCEKPKTNFFSDVKRTANLARQAVQGADESGSTTFEVSINDTTPSLTDMVRKIVSRDAKDHTDVGTHVDASAYYAVQFKFANPETGKMHEVIAVANPEAGQGLCAQFVSYAMNNLTLTTLQNPKCELHYSSHEKAHGKHIAHAKKPVTQASVWHKHGKGWQKHRSSAVKAKVTEEATV